MTEKRSLCVRDSVENAATDWLGTPYYPGIKVLYAVTGGRQTAVMALGRVTKVREKTVTIEPLRTSKSHYSGQHYYYDERTGDRIKWEDMDKHYVPGTGIYVDRETGEPINMSPQNYGLARCKFISRERQPYVKLGMTPTKSITLKTSSQNITVVPEDFGG